VIADLSASITAVSSLLGTGTVAFVAFSQWSERKKAESARIRTDEHHAIEDIRQPAMARTVASTAVNLANVSGKVDANTEITEQIHEEVKSINGQTAPEIIEAGEGRRIEADIPVGERTAGQQGYVDRLHDDE
jgi:uncharacterized membrane protein YebE (DUF533 family)